MYENEKARRISVETPDTTERLFAGRLRKSNAAPVFIASLPDFSVLYDSPATLRTKELHYSREVHFKFPERHFVPDG